MSPKPADLANACGIRSFALVVVAVVVVVVIVVVVVVVVVVLVVVVVFSNCDENFRCACGQ